MENDVNPKDKKVKIKKEKKPLTMKQMIIRRIIFIIIFLIFASAITVYLIMNKTSNPEHDENKGISKTEEKIQEVNKKKGLIDLEKDTYSVNNLDIVKYTEDYKGMRIEYFQIDGLLDNSIEVSINYALKNDIQKVLDKALEENKIRLDNFYAGAYFESCFANTLSLYYDISSHENTGDYEDTYNPLFQEYVLENFDLTTGNRLTIKDILTEDTKGKDLINASFYNEMISNYTTMDFENDMLVVKDYKEIEEEIYSLINRIDNNKDIKFVFNEQSITFLDYRTNIYYEDFIDNIAIYNKFKTEKTIFDGKYQMPSNLPVLARREFFEYQIIEQGENYYIDISLDMPDEIEDRNEIVYNSAINYLKSEIAVFKEKANETPSKFLIFNGALTLNTMKNWVDSNGMYEDCFSGGYTCLNYETTKSMFKAEIYNKIIDIFRMVQRISTGEAYLYNNLFIYYLKDDFEEIDSEYKELYIDGTGTIFNTQDDLNNKVIWGIED